MNINKWSKLIRFQEKKLKSHVIYVLLYYTYMYIEYHCRIRALHIYSLYKSFPVKLKVSRKLTNVYLDGSE